MTLLRSLEPTDVQEHPFPHVLIPEFVDSATCRRLLDAFPPTEQFPGGSESPSNEKLHYRVAARLDEAGLDPVWRELFEDHLGRRALDDYLRVFGPALLDAYPDFEELVGPLDGLRAGIRRRDPPDTCEVLLEPQLVVHTPVRGTGSAERAPHFKGPKKFLEAFLFLREPSDVGPGGEIELYSRRPGSTATLGPRKTVVSDELRLERRVPWASGTLFAFLNTPHSIQAIAPREPGPHPMRYFNFLAQVSFPLFSAAEVLAKPAPERSAAWS